MRRVLFGSLLSRHLAGSDSQSHVVSCEYEHREPSSPPSPSTTTLPNKINTADVTYGVHSNFSNEKKQFSPSSTFRSRKLTTATVPFENDVYMKNTINRKSFGRQNLLPFKKQRKMYASELSQHMDNANPNKNYRTGALPFPPEKVGTFTCHGLEPSECASKSHPNVDKITGLSFVTQKINQDRGSVVFPYANNKNTALFGVYDGHGDGGEMVSQFTMIEVERRLKRHPEFKTNIHKALKDIFLGIDQSLKEDTIVDPTFCGTTACIMLIRNNTLHVSNIGDSRAVLCRRRRNISSDDTKKQPQHQYIRTAHQLTQDQTPDVPFERSRIEKSGGYVSPSPEPGVSARVWINPKHTFLGLAMSRSVGDFFLKKSGVIAEPVVSSYDLNYNNSSNDEDEFIVLASDGVFEYIDSEEVVEIVGNALDEGLGASEACKKLILAAALRWKDFDYYYRDDITAIVVKVNGLFDGDKEKSDNIEQSTDDIAT